MSALALLAAAYLAIILIALRTGAVGVADGSIIRAVSPEGYWVMIITHGLAAFSALVATVT